MKARSPPTTPPALLSIREAASYLGIGKTVFRREVLPALPSPVRIGRRVLYRRTDLDEWIAQRAGPMPVAPRAVVGAHRRTPDQRAAQIEARLRGALRRPR